MSEISGTATDNVLVTDVQAAVFRNSDYNYWNGVAWTASESWLTASFAAPNWTYGTLPPWVHDTNYTVISRAVDSSSNWSVVYSTAYFRFDNVAPVSGVTIPANDSSPASVPVISGTASDSGSYIGQVWVKVRRISDDYHWNGSLTQWTAAEAWNLSSGSTTWTYSGLPEAQLAAGTTYFAVSRASDLASNVQASELAGSTFVYQGGTPPDLSNPTVAVLQPAHLAQLNSLPLLHGTAADNVAVASVAVSIFNLPAGQYWDGSAWGAGQAWLDASIWPSSWTCTTVPAWVESSSYVVVARAVDPSGNWTVPYATNVFTYDLTAPLAAITSPATGTYAAFLSLQGTAADLRGVAQVQVGVRRESDGLYWNGSAWASGPLWNAAAGTADWTYSGIAQGDLANNTTYLFLVRAADLAGNLSDPALGSSTFTFVLPPGDLLPPDVAFLNPLGVYLRQLAAVSGTASDNVAVASVTVSILDRSSGLYWDGSAWGAPAAWLNAALWPSSWTYTSLPAWTHASSYTIVARSADAAFNWSTVNSTWTFTYDTVQPYAAVTSPVPGTYGSFTSVSGTAADALSGIVAVGVSVRRESDGLYWNGSAWGGVQTWVAAVGTGTWTFSGITAAALESGTTYLFSPGSYDGAGNMSGQALGTSTFTYVVPPAGALTPGAFSGVGISSLTVNWGSTFGAGATYYVVLSSWTGLAPFVSSAAVLAAPLVFEGLTPDTSYYAFVSTAAADLYLASGSGATLAVPPAGVDFSSVAYTSATLAWAAGGNPGWTLYEFELSTASDFSAVASSGAAAALSYDFTGLQQWTPYYGRARAVNQAGVRSAWAEAQSSALTLFKTPTGSVTGLAGSVQGVSSITWTWSSGTVTDADLFSFYSGESVFLGTVTFGATGTFEQQGLTPNTSAQLRVRGRNGFGEGPLADSAALFTLAAVPGSPAFGAVGLSSVTLGWTAAGNPAGTVYEYQLSEQSNFSSTLASGSGPGLSALFTGLAQGATYYGRVRAVNGVSAPTAWAAAPQAVTGVLLPSGLPSALAGAALGAGSVSWTWNAGSVAAADYFVIASLADVQLSTAAFGATGAYIREGLGPNSPQQVRVGGLNGMGRGPLLESATVYTLAVVPAAPAAAAFVSSAALTLGLGGNPAGTVLQLWRSPDNGIFTGVYEGVSLSYADAGLAECSPYYYKARARNGSGLYSAFGGTTLFITQASTPLAPGGLQAEALDGARIALAWEPSPTVSVSRYSVYYDNAGGTVDYSVPLAVLSSTVTSWTTPALAAGSTYKFAVRAGGGCGAEEKNTYVAASAQAVGLLSGVRAAIRAPQAGKRVKGNSVTIVAELTLGLPSQISQVRFQYSPAGAGAWADIPAANPSHPNPDLAAPYFVHLDADALGAGAYDLRAVATDIYSVADPAAPTITIAVDPVDFEISESVSGGEQRKEQKVVNTVTSTLQAADDSTAMVSKVVIPAGAVTDSTAAVTLVTNPATVPAPPSGAEALNLAVKVNLSNGQSQLSSGKTAALSFTYKDDDNNGLVDGTLSPVERLRVYTAPDGGGGWTLLATTVDRANKTLTAVTPHFSYFSVFAAPAAGLNSARVYPVPWQPGSGGRFDAAGVTFSGLPQTARIRIYTLVGELVRQLDVVSADAGQKTWDGRNSEGSKAASGIYLALIKSGSDERTLKVAVER